MFSCLRFELNAHHYWLEPLNTILNRVLTKTKQCNFLTNIVRCPTKIYFIA